MENDSALQQDVIQRVKTLPEDQLRDVLQFVEALQHSEQASRSIEEKIARIVNEEPRDIWEDVPADGAENHDHYIYGRPKQNT
ncbi:hypothetical protein GGQ02_003098 [Salinibacter ruber]|uniref:DUF2281 domain-containing protein n=1 Tax=Salinibacter ruber TaxID=146919 RepID=UPI00207389F9|nr:DUF2281 domain-containing protein [Salinibacter ruber]MCS4034688.1 hypothetical protein [Salinibacter ruber]